MSILLLAVLGCKDGFLDDTGADDTLPNTLQYLDLGTHTTGDTGFLTPEIAVTVPEGATSVLVHCGPFGDDRLGLLWTLKNPDGSYLYDGNDPASTTQFRSETHDDLIPFLIPLSPDSPLQSGDYLAEHYVDGGTPADLDCGMVIRTEPVRPQAQVNAEFVWVGVEGIDASTAADDADVQAMLAASETMFSSANVSLQVSHSDFGGNVDTYAVVDVSDEDYSEYNDLLRSTAPSGDERSVVVYMVQEIADASGSTILGKAGGPPGVVALSGTSKSGIVVTTADLADDPAAIGRIFTHEAGHFLGLFHTTEADAASALHDPISDTPECPGSADSNSNGTLNSDECGGQGAENVMWWTFNAAESAPTFSGDQGEILRGSPAAL